mmetsp:Transcript_97985/g.169735  ORF Transcript_97985/g.169735 Transcript_97985/m.169735 type:complete len:282 (+) Transcript_97985:135-980(+)
MQQKSIFELLHEGFRPVLASDRLGHHLRRSAIKADADIKFHRVLVAGRIVDHLNFVIALWSIGLPYHVLDGLFAILLAVNVKRSLALRLLVHIPDLFPTGWCHMQIQIICFLGLSVVPHKRNCNGTLFCCTPCFCLLQTAVHHFVLSCGGRASGCGSTTLPTVLELHTSLLPEFLHNQLDGASLACRPLDLHLPICADSAPVLEEPIFGFVLGLNHLHFVELLVVVRRINHLKFCIVGLSTIHKHRTLVCQTRFWRYCNLPLDGSPCCTSLGCGFGPWCHC